MTHRWRTSLFAVPGFRLGEFILAHDVVADLHGVVPIRRLRLHLRHAKTRENTQTSVITLTHFTTHVINRTRDSRAPSYA